MNQTPTTESFIEEFTQEFIEEFSDDIKNNRRLELFHKIYGQSSTSTPRKCIFRDREAGHQRLVNDYFSPNPVYPENIFRRRFRMGRHVFLRIVDAISNFDPYFQQKIDAVGRKGLSPLQKCTAAMRMLVYGVFADAVDDYVCIGESTAVEALKKFVSNMGDARGFPGMMGSIDCMHRQWKNYPKAWKKMFMSGHKGVATIILEAVASSDLWIWHTFFGVAGSNNDINILDRSPVFDDVLQGRALEMEYILNGQHSLKRYHVHKAKKENYFLNIKKVKKDVERAFGVLQSCFAIVRGPARLWDKDDIGRIMKACIIIHNMIVEDERDIYATQFGQLTTYDDATNGLSQPNLGEEPFIPYEMYIQNTIQMRDKRTHRQLQNDLVEHISQFYNIH